MGVKDLNFIRTSNTPFSSWSFGSVRNRFIKAKAISRSDCKVSVRYICVIFITVPKLKVFLGWAISLRQQIDCLTSSKLSDFDKDFSRRWKKFWNDELPFARVFRLLFLFRLFKRSRSHILNLSLSNLTVNKSENITNVKFSSLSLLFNSSFQIPTARSLNNSERKIKGFPVIFAENQRPGQS